VGELVSERASTWCRDEEERRRIGWGEGARKRGRKREWSTPSTWSYGEEAQDKARFRGE